MSRALSRRTALRGSLTASLGLAAGVAPALAAPSPDAALIVAAEILKALRVREQQAWASLDDSVPDYDPASEAASSLSAALCVDGRTLAKIPSLTPAGLAVAWPWFAQLPWGCSLTQVDWRAEGFEGRRLGQLLAERRSFHDGHRALDDCVALLHLLQLPLTLGVTGFELMMREAAQVSVRVWATNSPFERKGILKSRGYRWSAGEGRCPRAWWRDVPETLVDAEVSFLREQIYGDPGAEPVLRRVTALERFSVRADAPGR